MKRVKHIQETAEGFLLNLSIATGVAIICTIGSLWAIVFLLSQ